MLYGEMVAAEDLNSYTITSTIPGVDSTSITVDTSGLTFDWADVTLEVYDVDECLKFPKVQLFKKYYFYFFSPQNFIHQGDAATQ